MAGDLCSEPATCCLTSLRPPCATENSHLHFVPNNIIYNMHGRWLPVQPCCQNVGCQNNWVFHAMQHTVAMRKLHGRHRPNEIREILSPGISRNPTCGAMGKCGLQIMKDGIWISICTQVPYSKPNPYFLKAGYEPRLLLQWGVITRAWIASLC